MDDNTVAAVEAWAGCAVERAVPLEGGEVGTVARVDLADGRRTVVKTGPTDPAREARMLEYLASEGGLRVPAVLHAGDDLLILEYVEGESMSASSPPAVERDLAERLASLHTATADAFGFPFDTLTGPYEQPNPWTESWAEFLDEFRLGHAASCAHDEGVLPGSDLERVERLVGDLPGLLDHDPSPSLIHGDVWRENVLTDGERVTGFVDPACYYADREVELAYVEWTGTGRDAFLDRYREVAGIVDGYDERAPVYRLYPLLTHLRYFGREYLDPVRGELAALGY